jgi:hypothetical protein
MKIADVVIGEQYGLAHPGNDPEDAYAKGTVTAKHPGGNVTVATNNGQQTIGAKYLVATWEVCAEAKRERRLRDEENSRAFDRRLVALETARQEILSYLAGADTDGLGYDLDPKYALGKEVKAHADRSGYWTGTGIRLDYVQIANLLKIVVGA